MAANASNSSGQQDWRLKATLDVARPGDAPRGLIGLLRGRESAQDRASAEVDEQAEKLVACDVAITHDGDLLFAYAPDAGTLASAREAIEGVLARERIEASITVSQWDAKLDSWRQTDPPPSPEEIESERAATSDAHAIETRTLVVSVGKMIRAEFEQSIDAWAGELGVECKLTEHPHLLRTQVAFTVTGSTRKLDEFARGLRAEENTTLENARMLQLGPL